MSKPAHLSLVKWKPEEDEPLTATALRQRLQTHAAAVSTLADDWATRDEPVSFKDFEQAIRLVVFAFARIAIMLFLALREDQLMRTYPSQVEREGRRFRRAPAIPRSLTTLFGVVRYARTYMREVGHHARRGDSRHRPLSAPHRDRGTNRFAACSRALPGSCPSHRRG